MSMLASLASIDQRTLEGFQRHPSTIAAFIDKRDDTPPERLQLHKMWHALHYMLTGTVWSTEGPLGQAILGGKDIGPDVGYGPARVLAPEQVRASSEALAKVSVADFRSRFAPSTMEAADIYPSGIWVREKDTILDELTPLFENLAAFYRHAAARKNSVLLWIR
jgi:hypothetical protein